LEVFVFQRRMVYIFPGYLNSIHKEKRSQQILPEALPEVTLQ